MRRDVGPESTLEFPGGTRDAGSTFYVGARLAETWALLRSFVMVRDDLA